MQLRKEALTKIQDFNTHFFHGNIWTHNWPAPKPRWSHEFFSGFFTQLHKLRSLRLSFLHFHQERLLRSTNFATMVTWRHTSLLYLVWSVNFLSPVKIAIYETEWRSGRFFKLLSLTRTILLTSLKVLPLSLQAVLLFYQLLYARMSWPNSRLDNLLLPVGKIKTVILLKVKSVLRLKHYSTYNPGRKVLGHLPFSTCFYMEFAANLQ